MTDKNGQPVFYIWVLNALYRLMKAALLYYQWFIADIKSIQFELNPYDPCIANKIVNKKQLILLWHMDDIKILHMDEQVVSNIIEWLKKTYEHIFEDGLGAIKVSHGKLHDCLGMQLYFSIQGQVKVMINHYVQAMLDEFYVHDPTKTTAKTLAAEHLFQVDEKATPLSKQGATIFYTFIAKALFLTKQSHPDIAIMVVFLTTHVMCPD